jgi:hypothetical protein
MFRMQRLYEKGNKEENKEENQEKGRENEGKGQLQLQLWKLHKCTSHLSFLLAFCFVWNVFRKHVEYGGPFWQHCPWKWANF